MHYQVCHEGVVVGTADLTPSATHPELLQGMLQPTPAFATIAATCRGLAAGFGATDDSPGEPRSDDVPSDDPAELEAFTNALGKIWALGLTLRTADGLDVPATQVMIMDFSPPDVGDLPVSFTMVTAMLRDDAL